MSEDVSAATGATGRPTEIEVALLTGGFDRPYAFGITMALIARGMRLDVIGSKEVESPEMYATPRLNFLKLQADPRQRVNLAQKLGRLMMFYVRLLWYAATAKPKIFHILWNNKVQFFDRTLLMLYYKMLGKKVVFTAHNVNAGKRDANDSFINRLTLKAQYRIADHIFVHTELMKKELLQEFGVKSSAVTVIPFGINNSVPNTDLTPAEAKQRLGIEGGMKTVLFFGSIRPYKGLERLVPAFLKVAERNPEYRLIIAGQVRKGCEQYLQNVLQEVDAHPSRHQVIKKLHFVPDSETELYFKAADVVVLPYVEIFQSGVLFLAYSFGLPAVVSDIGSFRDDVVEGENGFLYDPQDPNSLARTIEKYFASNLYADLDKRREDIRAAALQAHSWETVGRITRGVYEQLLAQ
jgi:glycosyltransferase involved in cell wall biosynthesis